MLLEIASTSSMREGWVLTARHVYSPNFDARPEGVSISLVVIHAISLPPSQFGGSDIVRLFTNTLDPRSHPFYPGISHLRVSSHFLIRRDGELLQFVSCRDRAWHAGVSKWQERDRCNDFSLGIELEGCDVLPFCDAQYTCLNDLLTVLSHVYPVDAVVGHSDVAPGRKTDPGPCFDWSRVTHPAILSVAGGSAGG